MLNENYLLTLNKPDQKQFVIHPKDFMNSPLASKNWSLLSSTTIEPEQLSSNRFSDLELLGEETAEIIIDCIQSMLGSHISPEGIENLKDRICMTQRGLVPIRWVCNKKGGITLLALDASEVDKFHVTDFFLNGNSWAFSYEAQGVSIHDAYPLIQPK